MVLQSLQVGFDTVQRCVQYAKKNEILFASIFVVIEN